MNKKVLNYMNIYCIKQKTAAKKQQFLQYDNVLIIYG